MDLMEFKNFHGKPLKNDESQEDFSLLEYILHTLEKIIPSAFDAGQGSPSVTSPTPSPALPQNALDTTPQSHLENRQNNPQDCSNLITASVDRATVEMSRTIIALNATFSQQLQQASISASNGIRSAEQSATQTISVIVLSASSVTSVAFSSLTLARFQVSNANLALTSATSSASSDVARLSSSVSVLQARVDSIQSSASSAIAASSPSSPQVISIGSPNQSSPGLALTPAQGAGIIIGVIILSVLLTVVVYFLVINFKRKEEPSERDSYLDEKSVAVSPRKVTGRSSWMTRTGNEVIIKFDQPKHSNALISSWAAAVDPNEVIVESVRRRETADSRRASGPVQDSPSPASTTLHSLISRGAQDQAQRSPSLGFDFNLPVAEMEFPIQPVLKKIHASHPQLPRIRAVNSAESISILARRMRRNLENSTAKNQSLGDDFRGRPTIQHFEKLVKKPTILEIFQREPKQESSQPQREVHILAKEDPNEDPLQDAIAESQEESFPLADAQVTRKQSPERLIKEQAQEDPFLDSIAMFGEEALDNQFEKLTSTLGEEISEIPVGDSLVDSSIKPKVDNRHFIKVSTTIDISISARAEEVSDPAISVIQKTQRNPPQEILALLRKDDPKNGTVPKPDSWVQIMEQQNEIEKKPLSWSDFRAPDPKIDGGRVPRPSVPKEFSQSIEETEVNDQARLKSRMHDRIMLEERERTVSPLRRNPVTRIPIVELSAWVNEPLPVIEKPRGSPVSNLVVEGERDALPFAKDSWIRSIASLLSEPDTDKAGEEEVSERQERGRSMIRTSDIIDARQSWRATVNEGTKLEIRIAEEGDVAESPKKVVSPILASPPNPRDKTLSPLRLNPFSPSPIATLSAPPHKPTIVQRSLPIKAIAPPKNPQLETRELRNISSVPTPGTPFKTLPVFENASRSPSRTQFSNFLSKFQRLESGMSSVDVAAASSEVTSRARAGIHIPGSLREQAVRTLSRSRDREGTRKVEVGERSASLMR